MDNELPLWIVSRIKGNKAEEIATVRAKDAAGAVAAVVKSKRSRIRSISSDWRLDLVRVPVGKTDGTRRARA